MSLMMWVVPAALILLAELLFSRLEYRVLEKSPEINLYVEYTDNVCLEELLRLFRKWELKILNMGVIRPERSDNHNACAIFTLRLPKGSERENLLHEVHTTPGVVTIREL